MEEERPSPPLIIITRVIHKNNSYTTKLGGPILKYVPKKDYLNFRLTLNEIYKGTSICIFNKFHLLKVKMHKIKKFNV